MAKGEDTNSEMALARQSDGINVIFDQNSSSSSRSRSRSRDRYSRRRHYKSGSKSSSKINRHRRTGSQLRKRVSQSPPRSNRRHSRSRSSRHSVSLTVDDKRELLQAAKANAKKMLGLEGLELPESVKPTLSEQCSESPVSETWVRLDPEESPSQSSDVEPDERSPTMSPKRKIISFSINNSVAKPTVAALSSAKVTPRMDSYESRKPYGHWVPVRSRKSSNARKHTLHTSH
ncbi:arginine/serine-rich protein 1 [Scomber scombrus]|uniref:Arginine/serine-rich protein 1 n=1 Tax=Scomber scombrus TaxID=13677 RepID=A0AAV1PBZ9_SCOSC